MEERAPQNGCLFIRFVTLTSTPVYSVVWNQSGSIRTRGTTSQEVEPTNTPKSTYVVDGGPDRTLILSAQWGRRQMVTPLPSGGVTWGG